MTPHGRIDDLLQRAADGLLDEADREALREWLARDPQAAERLRELRRLDALLRDQPELEPPGGLCADILRAAAARQATYDTRGSWEGQVMKTWKVAVFAAVAIVAVGALVYFEGFRSTDATEEAAGTIGAVEKYRAEQIGEQDVVIGGIYAQDAVPFADLVAEAAALGSVSRDVAGFAAKIDTLDAKSALAQAQRIQADLEARAQQLEAKTLGMAARQAHGLVTTLDAQIALGAKLQAASALDAKTAETLRAQAAAMAADLEAKKMDLRGASVQVLGATTQYLAASQLDAKKLESATATLDAITRQLEAKQLNLEAAQRQLGALSADLEARSALMQASTLDARAAYIQSAAAHHADLVGARNQLAALARELEAKTSLDAKRQQGMRSELGELGAKLQARSQDMQAKSLLDMRRQLDNAALEAKSLLGVRNSLDLASRAALGASAADLGAKSIADQLGKSIATLDAKRLEASSRLGAIAATDLGASTRLLQAQNLQLEAKSLNAMTDYLGQVSAVLEGRYSAVEAPAVQRLQTELNAATSALEAKTALQAKTQPE